MYKHIFYVSTARKSPLSFFFAFMISSAFSWNFLLLLFYRLKSTTHDNNPKLVGVLLRNPNVEVLLISYFFFDVQETQPEAEVALSPRQRKRKTTQDAHGSFFLRVGAIGKYLMMRLARRFIDFSLLSAFGLGSMIYIGLEFGTFFEVPLKSPCHEILRGVNPLLQMIFTFMQMYFIFMNSRVSRVMMTF